MPPFACRILPTAPFLRARRIVVDGLGQQFLAGARLAHDHDRHVAPEDAVDLVDDLFELRVTRVQVAQAGQPPGRCLRRRLRDGRHLRRIVERAGEHVHAVRQS